MQVYGFNLAGLLTAAFSLALSAAAVAAPLTLEQAWALAEQANPELRAAQANLIAAQGQATDARAPLWNNPEPFGDITRRKIPEQGQPDTNTRDWRLGLRQTFETGGQQRIRREMARENLTAVELAIADTRRRVRLDVAQQFFRVLGLQQRSIMERETLSLIESAAGAVRRRVSEGEDTRLDGNLAEIEAARARNQLALLQEQLLRARAELASMLQLPPGQLPEAAGTLARAPLLTDLPTLLASLEQRPDITASAARLRTAFAQLRLERATVSPDVTIGLSYGRDGSVFRDENVAGLAVSLPIPLFRRNATGIGRAVTERTQREIEDIALNRNVRAEIQALWTQMENLRSRVERLRSSVLPLLEENQRLSQTAMREGEIGLLQLLTVNRQLLDGRRDLIQAETELRLIEAFLDPLTGMPITTPLSNPNTDSRP